MKYTFEQLRVGKKLTQEEVAKYLGMSKVSYGKKERGEREFKFNELQKLEELYGIGIEYFAH